MKSEQLVQKILADCVYGLYFMNGHLEFLVQPKKPKSLSL